MLTADVAPHTAAAHDAGYKCVANYRKLHHLFVYCDSVGCGTKHPGFVSNYRTILFLLSHLVTFDTHWMVSVTVIAMVSMSLKVSDCYHNGVYYVCDGFCDQCNGVLLHELFLRNLELLCIVV